MEKWEGCRESTVLRQERTNAWKLGFAQAGLDGDSQCLISEGFAPDLQTGGLVGTGLWEGDCSGAHSYLILLSWRGQSGGSGLQGWKGDSKTSSGESTKGGLWVLLCLFPL